MKTFGELQLDHRNTELKYILVDTEESFKQAVVTIAKCDMFALDAEGYKLSRDGELTVLTMLSIESDVAFVVDVKVLGGQRVFSSEEVSLRDTLEDPLIAKITFDCRADSDALFHQYGVTLNGSIELQVLDQAVRIQNGDAPPRQCPYLKDASFAFPCLQSMSAVAERCLGPNIAESLTKSAPHKSDPEIWMKRRMSTEVISYAASDVHAIKHIFLELKKTALSDLLSERVTMHSARYEKAYRDLSKMDSVFKRLSKKFAVEELAIVESNELPSSHPRSSKNEMWFGNKALQKFNDAVTDIRSRNSKSAYDNAIYVLQHNDWYTDEAYDVIRELAAQYPFTRKQRRRIANPPELPRDDDYEYEYYDSDGY